MSNVYDTIIVTTASDYIRNRSNIKRIINNIDCQNLIFIGSIEVGNLLYQDQFEDIYGARISFINENEILSFDSVNDILKTILRTENVPRGITGWYYQQFLKMRYAYYSNNPYYMSWDGDTVPCQRFSMFDEATGIPYFDMKYEFHEEYFITLNRLFPDLHKNINRSYISEHMIFNCEIMKQLIADIESNNAISGTSFFEKILRAIRPGAIDSNSFSEFETYGTYVSFRYPNSYKNRNWHSIRYGSIYFIPDQLTDIDYLWISQDFDAVSFEKNQTFNPEIAALFTDPRYRSQLTARQIIEAIQDNSEGMREEWDD